MTIKYEAGSKVKQMLSTKLSQYVAIIIFLLVYAVLPQNLLSIAYVFYRLLALSILFNVQFPQFTPSFLKDPVQKIVEQPGHVVSTSIELLCAFQKVANELLSWLKSHRQVATLGLLSLVFLPNQLLFLTQVASIYMLSLFSYQLGSLVCIKGFKWLWKGDGQLFSPQGLQQQHLDNLNIAQMKLVTMFLVSVSTFLPLSYIGVVALFTLFPFFTPFCALGARRAFNDYYHYLTVTKEGRKSLYSKVVEACLFGASLLFLLVNYKYEHHIVNFLLAMYSSVLIGRIAKDFYEEKPNTEIESGDQILDIIYNPDVIHAFWAMCLMYEVSFIIFIPRVLFIVAAVVSGIDINAIPNYVLSLSTTVYQPVYNAMTYIETLSNFSVFRTGNTPGQPSCWGISNLFSPQKPARPRVVPSTSSDAGGLLRVIRV